MSSSSTHIKPIKPIKILSIGSDRKLFEEGSAVWARMLEYGKLFGEMHIIVFSLDRLGHAATKIGDNVWVYPTNSPSRLFYVSDALKMASKVAKEAGLKKEDTWITVQDPFESGLVGAMAKWRFGFPLLVQIHTDFASSNFTSASLLNIIRSFISRFVMKCSDRVRVVSKRVGEEVARQFRISQEKITVLPIAVDAEKIASLARGSSRQAASGVLMISRLAPEKDFKTALRAFKMAAGDDESKRLIIVGDGPLRESLEEFAEELGLRGRVSFEGWHDDTSHFYSESSEAGIFLSTSLFEGYGMSLIEAAAAGLAILTTEVGIVGDVLIDGESCLACPPRDVECLGVKLKSLFADEGLRQRLGQEARKSALTHVMGKEEYLRRYAALFE